MHCNPLRRWFRIFGFGRPDDEISRHFQILLTHNLNVESVHMHRRMSILKCHNRTTGIQAHAKECASTHTKVKRSIHKTWWLWRQFDIRRSKHTLHTKTQARSHTHAHIHTHRHGQWERTREPRRNKWNGDAHTCIVHTEFRVEVTNRTWVRSIEQRTHSICSQSENVLHLCSCGFCVGWCALAGRVFKYADYAVGCICFDWCCFFFCSFVSFFHFPNSSTIIWTMKIALDCVDVCEYTF